ncbi:MAG: MFS transporter [Pseudotabrizicola sp.]|uniref:MFS transporter n=1 Tax=Paracoccaceae TaxID=31989 RepID=UPI002730239F|nr:MFS transporter [Pseudotabrizicola sp.]MDP2079628.1 MFS transporter [Pseudotabrizicola sp.]MDZ7574609.1 MFS transporter [Pseudotabrizicola sp.]
MTYRRLWAATTMSSLGTLIQAVGAAWLMTTLTTSQTMVSLVQASNTLPIMAFSLIAGALADTYNRRRILIFAQMAMVLASAALAVTAWMDGLTPWMLLGFTFLIGCGSALYNPSWQASMGDIVPRDDLHNAISLNSLSFNMMRSIGPAAGGVIVAVAGPSAAFVINMVLTLPLIRELTRWRPDYPGSDLPPEDIGAAIGAGLRYILMSPALLKVLLRGAIFGTGAVTTLALLPLVARDTMQGTALTYGVLLGTFGLGAIGGGIANTRLKQHLSNEAVIRIAFTGYALAMLALGFANSMVLACLALLVAGACWVMALALLNVTVQLSTPRWVVGRALSFYQTATFGGMALGSWLWGSVAEAHGLPTAFVVAAALLTVGGLLGLWLPLAAFPEDDLGPLGRFRPPTPMIDIKPRSGPIMVMIDYDIGLNDTPRFLALMRERRRIRLRDGARQWTLMRDIERPETWIESYHVPTWIDYMRHNQRRTTADADNLNQLNALHRGLQGPQRVHRLIERQTVPLTDDLPPVTSGTIDI